jgi:hypothetical protein
MLAESNRKPWAVDRWGRLLAGLSVLVLTLLGILHRPEWLIGTLLVSIGLLASALTDRCLMHDLLLRMGAREREDLFLPGGSVRTDAFTTVATSKEKSAC